MRRGFCKVCGSSLFFDIVTEDRIGLSIGAFDTPTGIKLALHIYVADKGAGHRAIPTNAGRGRTRSVY